VSSVVKKLTTGGHPVEIIPIKNIPIEIIGTGRDRRGKQKRHGTHRELENATLSVPEL
jgi:hypothetical protein